MSTAVIIVPEPAAYCSRRIPQQYSYEPTADLQPNMINDNTAHRSTENGRYYGFGEQAATGSV